MNKKDLTNLYLQAQKQLKKAAEKTAQKSQHILNKAKTEPASWWQIALGIILSLIFLYYPIGGMIVHDIDTSSTYQPKTENNKLASVDMMSHLINREVHYKIWTPNLPFLFPSYFLDNMPNFQLGLMSAVSKTTSAFSQLPLTATTEQSRTALNEAAEFLKYPGNVWLFSPQNKLLPVPSANTQYKKGRKKLNNFNNDIATNKILFSPTPQNLSVLLGYIKKDLSKMTVKTENHIRENHDSFIDSKADDVFYFDLGKLYAYSQILKALGYDFKDVLIKYDIYQQWTAALRLLQEATDLNPTIVRNGRLNSSFAPNHLATINYFAARTINKLNTIINKLNQPTDIQ